jgi:hypothetical protein
MNVMDGFSQRWAFVLNPIVMPDGAPFELGPGLFLRKANDSEIYAIKHTLDACVASPFGFSKSLNYECQLRVEKLENGNSSLDATPLQPHDWRYHVVTNDGEQNQLYLAHLAANVIDCPLEISALTFSGPSFSGWRPSLIPRYFTHAFPMQELHLTVDDIAQLRQTLQGFRPHGFGVADSPYPEINRAFQAYDSLNFLIESSDFDIIGLFSIIEMLITHNPESKDIGDSITHQMQSKLPLLMRRFERPVTHDRYFDSNVSIKKIWSALYAYRSAVAHGGVVDFSAKDLRLLKSAATAKAYLRGVVRALLRHILKEPQLFRDLKAC